MHRSYEVTARRSTAQKHGSELQTLSCSTWGGNQAGKNMSPVAVIEMASLLALTARAGAIANVELLEAEDPGLGWTRFRFATWARWCQSRVVVRIFRVGDSDCTRGKSQQKRDGGRVEIERGCRVACLR